MVPLIVQGCCGSWSAWSLAVVSLARCQLHTFLAELVEAHARRRMRRDLRVGLVDAGRATRGVGRTVGLR